MNKKKQVEKRKYKVEYKLTETFIVDVYAKNQTEAQILAGKKFDAGDYQEAGEGKFDFNCVYDVTNTDDPFYP